MKYLSFVLLLACTGFYSCDDPATEYNTDGTMVQERGTDGVNAKAGGETSTYEDQSTKSSLTTGTADYDGENVVPSELRPDDVRDTLEYRRSPKSFSTSPVKPGIPNSTENY